ncbi:cobalt ECF transporter T component CbiQ [uncultured Rummeliibacillus sp.]|uniref:cobalt ECF transporter T component CbiQ n=1 Tax=uncultured Rummeliibacillus sp. TaxID=762292 RepID=UPI0026103EE1|nr:cobalt ECF transporter T component CbiQ [uncultured Rummeliibacillus sp.]
MLLIDQYAYINRLTKTHPLEKIVLSIFLLVFSLSAKDILVSLLTFLIMSTLTVFVAKIPWKYYLTMLSIPGIFLISSMISILISYTQQPERIHEAVWEYPLFNGTVYIASQSIQMCIQLFFSVFSSISCLYFLTLTTPVHDLMHILRKCKVPQLMIELIELNYRFIFVFLEISLRIYQAQNSRLGYLSVKKGLHSLGMLVASLFANVFLRSRELTIAMDSRGYHNSMNYLENSFQYSSKNWTFISIVILFIIGLYIKFGGVLV